MPPTLTHFVTAATLAMAATALPALAGGAYDFDSSLLNYQNSELNYDNSTLNYRNSPLNYDNSRYNPRSNNGVYDNTGKRIGYEVEAPSGVVNIFDNEGNRIGYQPAKRR